MNELNICMRCVNKKKETYKNLRNKGRIHESYDNRINKIKIEYKKSNFFY